MRLFAYSYRAMHAQELRMLYTVVIAMYMYTAYFIHAYPYRAGAANALYCSHTSYIHAHFIHAYPYSQELRMLYIVAIAMYMYTYIHAYVYMRTCPYA